MPRGLELLIAQTILQGFDAQYGRFLEVTSGAQQRFEQADWHAVQQAMKNRIHLYDHHVGLVVEQLRCITNGQSTDAAFLLRVKEHYTRLLPDYPRFEIAESFFNSVYCRLFDHRSLTPERLFIFSSQPERRFRTIPRPLAKDFHPDHGWESLLMRVISDLPLRLRWQNKSRDIHYIVRHLTEDTWGQQFEKMGKTYQQPKLVMYRGMTRTGCGAGQSIMGPFYCPADGTVYIDLSFYDDMKDKLGADGDFAQGYVIAHEVGHHVQKLLGIEPKVRQLQQNATQAEVNRLSVRMELQADCFSFGAY